MTKPIDRRSFLRFGQRRGKTEKNKHYSTLSKLTTLTTSQSGLSPYQGPWEIEQITHLLRRTMFGAQNTDVYQLQSLSPTEAVDLLLEEPPLPDPPINDFGLDFTDPVVPQGAEWIEAPPSYGDARNWRMRSLKCWWLGNQLEQGLSLREKMVMFWYNHIPVEFGIVGDPRFCYRYLATLYENAFGNFKAIVKAITIDPAMLVYLNGNLNNFTEPDENYSRELQELFCIGKGPAAAFTEEDVQAAARVLTGWKSIPSTAESYFSEGSHDTDDKQFSEFYNHTIITGKAGPEGADELDELLDMIFDNDETSRFIVRKLYTFFVYQEITEEIENDIILPLSDLLRESEWEIKPVLEMLLKSEHFFDPWFRGAMLKSPLEQVVGMCREVHVTWPDSTDFQSLFQLRMNILSWLPDMLQDMGNPPDVSGWPAWFQAPIYYKWWITVATLPKRAEHTDLLIDLGYASDADTVKIDVVKFTETLPDPYEPNAVVDEVLRLFYGIEIVEVVWQQFKDILLDGQAQDYYWTDAWSEYIENPNDAMAYSVVETRLHAFYRAIFQLEEYQIL